MIFWVRGLLPSRAVQTFEEAQYVRTLGLKNQREWKDFKSGGTLRYTGHPNKTYKNYGWISLGDFLGTETNKRALYHLMKPENLLKI